MSVGVFNLGYQNYLSFIEKNECTENCTLVRFGIFSSETVWVSKPVKWVVLSSKSSLATIKQVSKSSFKKG